jgi:mannose-1-phosphate guanylyltransferase
VSGRLWAIILAAGDGGRVATLTTDAAGSVVPKQYWSFGGETTMLRWAVDRARGIVAPERVVVVVAERHRPFWSVELADLPPENVVVQPHNRGTAAGLLLPLSHVLLHLDAEACVMILPSDHFVAAEGVLRRTLRRAVRALPGRDGNPVLLGMGPRLFDPEYGWIVPSPLSPGPLHGVRGFVEKPKLEAARDLMDRGALVNAFMLVADAGALLRLYDETLPELSEMFRRHQREGGAEGDLEELYARIPVADFSRDVLAHAPDGFSVLRVPECGWSDLGTPARIQIFLSERSLREERAACLAGGGAALGAGK